MLGSISKANPAQTFTGIWCAKETVIKLLRTIIKLIRRNIEIISSINSSPNVLVHSLNIKDFNISISISHTKYFANATAITLINNLLLFIL